MAQERVKVCLTPPSYSSSKREKIVEEITLKTIHIPYLFSLDSTNK